MRDGLEIKAGTGDIECGLKIFISKKGPTGSVPQRRVMEKEIRDILEQRLQKDRRGLEHRGRWRMRDWKECREVEKEIITATVSKKLPRFEEYKRLG